MISVSLWFLFDLTSVSLRCHFEITSTSLRSHLDSTSLSLRSHFQFTSVSLRSHSDSTSISLRLHFGLRVHFGLTSVSHRFHFDFSSISLWPPLNPRQSTEKAKASGPTATREPAAPRKPQKSLGSFEKRMKAYQYPLEIIQEPPGILHDLTEQLFI